MTLIRVIEPKPASTETWRAATAAVIGNYGELAEMPWSVVRKIEIFPGCTLDAPRLIVPEDWVPAGAARRLSNRTIDPSLAGVDADAASAEMRDETVRRALLALWLPRASKKGIHQYKPRPWLSRAGQFLRMCHWQMANRPGPNGSVLSHLSLADLLSGMHSAPTERIVRDCQGILRALLSAAHRGIITDYPRIFDEIGAAGGGRLLEKARKGDAALVPAEKVEARSYQPFSDEFVTEIIKRAIWFQSTLAPSLILCWSELRKITETNPRRSGHPTVIRKRRKFLKRFPWTDPAGVPIETAAYPFEQLVGGRYIMSTQWPPRDAETVNRLMHTLQSLNLCMIAFCTGARDSELSAAEDNVPGDGPGRLHSVTFKLVAQVGGQQRDWPLHPLAVKALEVQHDLASPVRPPDQKHVWVLIGKNDKMGQPLFKLTDAMANAVKHLGLSHLTGTDRAHLHRWRHTVARLVALSVIGAPQVLLDLFGHRDLDMTLRYMLSDPWIIEDAMRVAKETSFVMAENAVAETLEGKTSGPAAPLLKEGLIAAGMRRGEEAFDTATLRETTEVLTFNGRHWSLVRDGVICTKGLGEFGPCTQGRDAPDPGGCRTDCSHRLETARAKQSCESALRALLREREHAAGDGAEMLLANVDGQIIAQLKRWDDVRERILGEFPHVVQIWEGERA